MWVAGAPATTGLNNLIKLINVLWESNKHLSAPWRPGTPHISSKSRQGAGRVSTRYHARCSFGPHLPAEVSSEAATCPAAPGLTSLLRWAPVMPHGSWPQASSPCWVELRHHHVFLSSGPRLPAEVGSDAATCSMAPDSASLRGELRRCNVFLSSGPRFPAKVGSDAATWHRPRLPERRALVLPRTPRPPAGCGPQE
jgi:hypothetical protein